VPSIVGVHRSSDAPNTKFASRISAADVSAAVCSSLGLRLMVSSDCFAVIAMRSSRDGGSRRDQTDLLKVVSLVGEAIGKGGSEFERIETASRFLWSPRPEGYLTSPRNVYRCLMLNGRKSKQPPHRWPTFNRHREP